MDPRFVILTGQRAMFWMLPLLWSFMDWPNSFWQVRRVRTKNAGLRGKNARFSPCFLGVCFLLMFFFRKKHPQVQLKSGHLVCTHSISDVTFLELKTWGDLHLGNRFWSRMEESGQVFVFVLVKKKRTMFASCLPIKK